MLVLTIVCEARGRDAMQVTLYWRLGCVQKHKAQICPKTFIHDCLFVPQQSSSINCYVTFSRCVGVRFSHFVSYML